MYWNKFLSKLTLSCVFLCLVEQSIAEPVVSTELTVPNVPVVVPVVLTAQQACMQIAKRLESVKEQDCLPSNQLVATGQLSVEGRPILEKVFNPPHDDQVKARVLMIGGIHGDELTSVSIVFNWMRILHKDPTGNLHWKVVPALNPDGLLRKTESTRVNARGVDLNRNFPAPEWKKNALDDYWAKQTNRNPRRYPGPTPLSEPESLWLAQEIERYRPDVIVTVHAPYGIVDFDGPPEGPNQLGKLYLNPLGTYPGSLGNYAGLQKNIPVVTIELKYAKLMPPEAEVNKIWADLLRWIDLNIPKSTPPLYVGIDALMDGLAKEKEASVSPKLMPSNELKELKPL